MPALGGFLVVTASEDTANAFHGNTSGSSPTAKPSHAQKIATFEVAMKAEGLAILGVEKDGAADVRQALDHLRQRPARDPDSQPIPDGHARSRGTLAKRVRPSFTDRGFIDYLLRAIGTMKPESRDLITESLDLRPHGVGPSSI